MQETKIFTHIPYVPFLQKLLFYQEEGIETGNSPQGLGKGNHEWQKDRHVTTSQNWSRSEVPVKKSAKGETDKIPGVFWGIKSVHRKTKQIKTREINAREYLKECTGKDI